MLLRWRNMNTGRENSSTLTYNELQVAALDRHRCWKNTNIWLNSVDNTREDDAAREAPRVARKPRT
jgi:hypothetical protein